MMSFSLQMTSHMIARKIYFSVMRILVFRRKKGRRRNEGRSKRSGVMLSLFLFFLFFLFFGLFYGCMCANVYMYVCRCICMHICVCICMCMCISVCMYEHLDIFCCCEVCVGP